MAEILEDLRKITTKTPADRGKSVRGKAEQGIMEAKSADTFKPEGWTPKFNVIETWNKAFPKH